MSVLLEITGLRTEIRLRDKTVRPVNGVSLTVSAGECLGLVGESGCGKTMTARSVLRLLPAGGVITEGAVLLDGTDLTQLSEQQMHQIRGNDIGMVFQDPASSMNSPMTFCRQLAETGSIHIGAHKQVPAPRA